MKVEPDTIVLVMLFFKGWYKAKVVEYNEETDTVKLEFDTEKCKIYSYCVKEEVEANKLKLAKDSQRNVDEYKHFFQIGTVIEIM